MRDATPVPAYVELPGCDVAGPAGAPVLLLVHANGWSRKMWLPQMSALSDTFRLLAPDLPGFGTRADEHFSLDAAVRVIEQTRVAQHAERVLLVGMSLGGYAAMTYARRFPEHLAGLALAGCSVRFTGRIRLLSRLSAAAFAILGHGPFLTHLNARQIARVRAEYPASLAEAQIKAGFSFANWGRALAQMAGADFDRLLSGFPSPVLLLNGEIDTYNRAAEAACLETLRHGACHVIAGAGHICNLDAPAIFSDELRAFASSLLW